MRFLSLYSYSLKKSPKDLRLAIVACRLSLILAIIAFILFLLTVFVLFTNKSNHNYAFSSLLSDQDDGNSLEFAKQSDNFTNLNTPSVHFRTVDFSAIIFLLIGFILYICVTISSIYAYVSYRNYRQSRMVNYEMINRSFDQMYSEQIAKLKIKDPIIVSSNPKSLTEAITVIKVVESRKPTTSMPCTAVLNNNPEHRNKFKFWSRNKHQRQLQNQRRFSYGKAAISKEMTI
ncbi:uncharacterized protein LOC124492632 [Dermatophagoides farinae]|uniref:Uncharacterized protein n=1 Tax=Dermatophagoides farinae TaxID=6954 RepID=A0A9D4P703_DERFA|nr:uncharacterized protein LOC124492632 [Dermatophagoides farinae]KAH7645960.1 hypothetical protein HUG17_1498 [Dermatophagoides farinae]